MMEGERKRLRRNGPFGSSRRTLLRALGATFAGGTLARATGPVRADDTATVIIDDQSTDGDSVSVSELTLPESGELELIADVIGEPRRTVHTVELDAETEWTDERLSLDDPLDGSRYVLARVHRDGDHIDRSMATVAVEESLDDLDPNDLLADGYEHVVPDDGVDFHHPYAVFFPEANDVDAELPILLRSLNSPRTETDIERIRELHYELRDTVTLFEQLDVPVVVAGFPRTPDDGPDIVQSMASHAVEPDERLEEIATEEFPVNTLERIDEQTISMIADARDRLSDAGFDVADAVRMHGFSSGASFADRFSFLHPDNVTAVSTGGNGAFTLPLATMDDDDLPYPIGTADYEDLTGRDFDEAAWAEIDRLVFLGEEDQPLPETDPRSYWSIVSRASGNRELAESVFGINRVTERFPFTESEFEAADAAADFRLYEGVGHRMSADMQDDVLAFHGAAVRLAVDLPSIGTKPVGDSFTVDVHVRERTGTSVTGASATLSVDSPSEETSYEATIPIGHLEGQTTVEFGSDDGTAEVGPLDQEGEHTATVEADASGVDPVTTTTSFSVSGDPDDEGGSVAAYADSDGIVRSGGLLDATSDFRSDEIDSGVLLEVAAAFRTGEPVT